MHNLGPFQTSNLTCAESNANEKNLLFSLICIRFGTCKVRRLKRALIAHARIVHFLCPFFTSIQVVNLQSAICINFMVFCLAVSLYFHCTETKSKHGMSISLFKMAAVLF